jgi:hypothetical protein
MAWQPLDTWLLSDNGNLVADYWLNKSIFQIINDMTNVFLAGTVVGAFLAMFYAVWKAK